MIGIASDHGGYELKEELKKEFDLKDYGTYSLDSVDYPDYAFKVAEAIKNGEIEKGILVCTTGIGMSIAANKVKGIRCAKVDTVEETKMTRLHNDANMIAISGNNKEAIDIVKTFIETAFSNEERHLRRINKIKEYEDEH